MHDVEKKLVIFTLSLTKPISIRERLSLKTAIHRRLDFEDYMLLIIIHPNINCIALCVILVKPTRS
jgi:hypothetical protein